MIPRICHRIWLDEPIPTWAEDNWRGFQELHPGWEFRTWTSGDEAREWVRNRDLFDSVDQVAGRTDVLRYEIVARLGGIYVDTDVEALRPFDALLDGDPFMGWENDRRICPTVIGGEPHHPALEVLVDELPAWAALHEHADAATRTGPEFVTQLWRDRDDVRRFPPAAFYPVGWWEKHLLGKVAYPSETFAVHHWAKGWGKPAATTVRKGSGASGGSASILVPFRDVDGSRSVLWEFVHERLERLYPEAELIVASDDGSDPFHKTLALNRAAAEATGDIFILYDADTLVDIEALRDTVAAVEAEPMRWAQPYNQKVKLNEVATEAVLAAGIEWDGTLNWRSYGRMESHTTFNAAPPLVVSRQAWDIVHGMDENFRGWGEEDLAFSYALTVLCGPPQRQRRGEALHLWHPRIGVSGNDLWPGQDAEGKKFNISLKGRYRQARTPDAMRKLLEERDDGRSLYDGNGHAAETNGRVHPVILR